MSGQAYLVTGLLLSGFVATYFWRFLAVLLAGRIDPEGEALLWLRAVATALVAALVMRIVVAPAGILAETELASRLLGLAAGIAVFFVARRSVEIGVLAAVSCFCLLELLL